MMTPSTVPTGKSERVEAGNPRRPPAADDHQTDDEAGGDEATRLQKANAGERHDADRRRDREGQGLAARAAEAEQIRKPLRGRAWQVVGEGIGQADAGKSGDAAHGHHRGECHDQERYQRLEVAAAEPQQGAEAAGADQRHAEAEHQSADQRTAPFEARAGIDRTRQVEFGEYLERRHAGDGHGDRQHPGAQASRVIAVDRVLDGAERAEATAPRGKAEHDSQRQSARSANEVGRQIHLRASRTRPVGPRSVRLISFGSSRPSYRERLGRQKAA
jgi:hypothetical protein